MRRATWSLVGVAVAVAVIAGALAVRARTDADPRSTVNLSVSVEQWRRDEVDRKLQVALRNDGPLPVRVERLELLAPSFDGIGPMSVDAPLPAGGLRVDLPVSYGTSRCAGDELNPVSAPAHIALLVRTQDGRVHPTRLALEHPNALLNTLLARDCQRQLLVRVATVGFGPWTVAADGSLRGSVVVERAGSGPAVTLHDLAGSVNYLARPEPADRPRPLGVLGADQSRLTVPIHVTPDRCTGHAIGDSSKPFAFPAWVSLADGPKLHTEIAVTDADRAALNALTVRGCAPTG